jgi:7-cyano-7-deazaguanine reductase
MDNTSISKHLGQISEYKDQYDPSLLVREPRASNRIHLNIDDDTPPFVGSDTWNNYEVSALTDTGMPVVSVAKIVYSACNKFIVESKSLKLYFNTFNMTKMGSDSYTVRRNIERLASEDLSKLLETKVEVELFSDFVTRQINLSPKNEWMDYSTPQFITLEEDSHSIENIDVTVYDETPSLLEVVKGGDPDSVYAFHSALLRSRCRVTQQPDTGDVYIWYKGGNTVTRQSLLKYIISFRNECHFHEEICEAIYKRLWDMLEPESLVVRCLYARRGGIDINPERASDIKFIHNTLSIVNIPHVKTSKQ